MAILLLGIGNAEKAAYPEEPRALISESCGSIWLFSLIHFKDFMSSYNRLTYIANARLPTEKAHGYQIIKMCEAFSHNDKQVELVYPFRFQPSGFNVIDNIYRQYSVSRSFKMTRLFSLDTIFLAGKLPRRFQPLIHLLLIQAFSYAIRASLYLRRNWSDQESILFGRDEYTFWVLSLQRRKIKAKLVYEAHTLPGQRWRSARIGILKNVDGWVVTTQQLKRLYVEAGVPEGKICVAADGVDFGQFAISTSKEEARRNLGLPLERPIIGFIGRFETMGMEKGIPELIRALPYINRRNSSKALLVCVGGPMEAVPRYERIIHGVGNLSDQVMFVDRRPTMEVPLWIRACDVCTIPWEWNEFSAYYTSPMKLFEYMATGAAIVASDLPSLREVLRDGENALLVPPGDPKGLAHGIQRLLDKPEFAVRIAQQAQMDAKHYTWDIRARKILAFINHLDAGN